MKYENFIEPKELDIVSGGKTKKFVISKMPLFPDGVDLVMGSREFCSQWISTGLPKIGDYKANESLALIMYSYVAVKVGEVFVVLDTPALINNHVTDVATSYKIEGAVLEHNLGFSVPEKISGLLDKLSQLLDQSSSKILTGLQQQLSAQEKPASES